MSAFTMRPATFADIPALVEVWATAWRERDLPVRTTHDTLRTDFSRPSFDPATMTLVAEADGRIVATASIDHEAEQAYWGGYVVPEYRGRGIGSTFAAWALERARSFEGVTEFWASAAAERTEAIELLENIGLTHIRSWYRMRHGRPASIAAAEWPDGIVLRALDGEELLDALIAGYNGSFIDHFNFHPAPRDEWEHFMKNHPFFDPSLVFVAFRGDELAGMCVTELQPVDDGTEGELGPIGTLRPFRGIGLGRALLRHGTRALADRGVRAVTLGVDSINPNGAVRLYETNGYERTHEGRTFRMPLERA